MLRCENVTKFFGKQKALDNINLIIEKGEFVAIMGPSGSGKSTLLNMLSGIDSPSNGIVVFNNQNLQKIKSNELEKIRQKQMGFIFQEYHILDTLTCGENIGLPLTIQKYKKKEILNKIDYFANLLEIKQLLDKFPYSISGGEKQRVAVARALITQPYVLYADEPTGALDSKNAFQLLNILKKQNEQEKQTIVMVTHDPFSASFASKILFIKDGNIYHTLEKGAESRKNFFEQIIQVTTMLGGEFDVI